MSKSVCLRLHLCLCESRTCAIRIRGSGVFGDWGYSCKVRSMFYECVRKFPFLLNLDIASNPHLMLMMRVSNIALTWTTYCAGTKYIYAGWNGHQDLPPFSVTALIPEKCSEANLELSVSRPGRSYFVYTAKHVDARTQTHSCVKLMCPCARAHSI